MNELEDTGEWLELENALEIELIRPGLYEDNLIGHQDLPENQWPLTSVYELERFVKRKEIYRGDDILRAITGFGKEKANEYLWLVRRVNKLSKAAAVEMITKAPLLVKFRPEARLSSCFVWRQLKSDDIDWDSIAVKLGEM